MNNCVIPVIEMRKFLLSNSMLLNDISTGLDKHQLLASMVAIEGSVAAEK